MKKCGILGIGFILLATMPALSQEKFYTKTGMISFFSSTPVENITAVNRSVVCLLNLIAGDIQFSVLMKGFEFKKALMQEHFNAEYLETDKFPKAEFKGQITNNSSINYKTNGSYPCTVKGKLTIHGVTKDVESAGNGHCKGWQTSGEFIIQCIDRRLPDHRPKIIQGQHFQNHQGNGGLQPRPDEISSVQG